MSKFNFHVDSIIWNSFIQAVVDILPRSICRQTWGDIWHHENQICIADEDGASPCNADSGGPIAVQESDSIVLFTGRSVKSFKSLAVWFYMFIYFSLETTLFRAAGHL